MANQLTERIDLLIAMTSGDVIVLAKLVHTVQPRSVLLLSTPYAQDRGWAKNARRMLQNARGSLIERFRINTLSRGALGAQLRELRGHIEETLDNISGTEPVVAFDCTTGRGLFRVLGYEACRQLVAARGWPMRVVFCDANARQVLTAADDPHGIATRSLPIQLQFSPRLEHVVQRFAMYGASVPEFTRLWPRPKADTIRHPWQPQTLLSLYNRLCNDESLRVLFHSYWDRVKEFKRQQVVVAQLGPDYIQRFIDQQIDRVANELTEHLPRPSRDTDFQCQQVRWEFRETVEKFVNHDWSVDNWLEVYCRDRQLRALNRVLKQTLLPRILDIIPTWPLSVSSANQTVNFNWLISRKISNLIKRLRHELDRVAILSGRDPDPSAISGSEHRAFRRLFLKRGLPETLRKLLMDDCAHVAELFELAAGWAIADTVDRDAGLAAAVDSIYRNVVIRLGCQSVCELDTLVIFRTGDLLALEAKTHFASADRKKIESNIKQLRDFGGAYSQYVLVYPLTADELEALADEADSTGRRLASLSVSDTAAWAEHVRAVARSRDQRIVGLDRLAEALRHAAGLYSPPAMS